MNVRARKGDGGAAAVEFALVAGILFTLIFGTIQYGLYFWSLQSGAHAAREAARQAAVGALDCTAFDNAILTNSRGEKAGTLNATRTFFTDLTMGAKSSASPDGVEIGHVVKVVVSFDSIDLGLPFVPFIDNGKVSEQAVARVENTTGNSTDCT